MAHRTRFSIACPLLSAVVFSGCFISIHELEEAAPEDGTGSSGGTSSSGAAPSGGTAGEPGTGGVSSNGGSESTGGMPPEIKHPSDLLDDFEDGDSVIVNVEGRRGMWTAANGGTGWTSVEGAMIPTRLEVPRGNSEYAMHISGGDYTGVWGAAWAAALNDPFLNEDEQPYDLSEYDGLLFWAKGSGQLSVELKLTTTAPVEEGGTCTENCNGSYSQVVTLEPDWTPIVVPFSELTQPEWAPYAPFEITQGLAVNFTNHPSLSDFDVWIDDVAFY